jgi:hypothetical protein
MGLPGKLSGIHSYTRAKIKPKRGGLAAWSGLTDPRRVSAGIRRNIKSAQGTTSTLFLRKIPVRIWKRYGRHSWNYKEEIGSLSLNQGKK